MTEAEKFRNKIKTVKRVVVKIGSAVLTSNDGLDTGVIDRLAEEIAAAQKQGCEFILVSSGAIASGYKKVGLPEKPKSIQEKQACAAVGQASLIQAYEKAFARFGFKTAQILLTASDLSSRNRYLNARNTLTTLLEWGIIPVINENDTVVVAEIKVGDNDTLSWMITSLVEAELLINLTDIDGLYKQDPRRHPEAEFIPLVKTVTRQIEELAGNIPGALGTGGMYTKVEAAKRLAKRGVPTVIANGRKAGTLTRILKGEPEGTLFLPRDHPLGQRKHWIAYTAGPRGLIVIDEGATRALLEKGKSLLPSGILRVTGRFNPGDPVQVKDQSGRLVAIGLTNYSFEELSRIRGCQTGDIESVLGSKPADEVIHRNNMVVGQDLP